MLRMRASQSTREILYSWANADNALQIHGGYGVTKEFPFERWYREARVRRIGEGPSEVHRMVVARSLLR